ncbi:MAG: GntR family transcriptional regulator [Opitutaceae bacterium]|jgi:DNA-binding LacI/PurR family transcriptional regulator|nr:GntR family transcriptional regulator [Opitutaceae bacterium]
MSLANHVARPPRISSDTNRRDEASEKIKDYILTHRLKPGERLPTLRKLSDTFEVTRNAVWRALRRLHEEEWLDALPNKRYTVSDKVYTSILRSIRVKAFFYGDGYIYFSGFRRLADALSRECRYHNIDLHIHLVPRGGAPDEKAWEDCDIVLVDSDSSRAFLKTFASFPVPVIGLDANYSDLYRANIVTDHLLGGRIAAEAMLARDDRHASVVYHAGSENNPRIMARIDGFRQTWLEAGRPLDSITMIHVEWSNSSLEIALKLLDRYKDKEPRGSYFVTDGRLATNFLEAMAYKRVPVPETVSVIGYDGAQNGELTDPPLTTIQQDMERIAESAVRWIREIASGNQEKKVLERVAPVFIKRGSF